MPDPLRNEEVWDLHWLLEGPGLLDPAAFPGNSPPRVLDDSWFHEQAQCSEKWLRHCDKDPEPLQQDLAERLGSSPLLGKYFEALLSFWIRGFLVPELFFSNVAVHGREPSQVLKGRRTVGELDFLFRLPPSESSGRREIHWEAAVKFYLFAGSSGEDARESRFFLGAHARDRLDKKIRRIFEHQLILPVTPDGRAAIEGLGFTRPCSQAWVKGTLFYPSHIGWRTHPHPREISPAHSRGWWTTVDRLEIPTESSEPRWILLPKRRWLSPARVSPESLQGRKTRLLTKAEMRGVCEAHFREHRTPLMWAEMGPEGSGEWKELNRGLVVFAGWLAAAQSEAVRMDAEPAR